MTMPESFNPSPACAILPVRKQEHVGFLHQLFNSNRGESLRINRSEFAGRFIFSLRQYSDKPLKQGIPEGYTGVPVEFPDTGLSSHQKRFCYFPMEHVQQINDFISSCFDLYFHVYFFDTRDLDDLEDASQAPVNITRQMLVDSFVLGLDMEDFSRATETVKKREYRQAVKEMVRKQQRYLKKDYNFRRKIYERRRKHLKNMLVGILK